MQARGLAITAAALLSTFLSAAQAQAQCAVTLNEVNYDCALAAGTNSDSCEFIELLYTDVMPGDKLHACGVVAIEFFNGSDCGSYNTIDLATADEIIPFDRLVVVSEAGVANSDYVPAGGLNMQNGAPDWIKLVGASADLDQWYAYEFESGDRDCSGSGNFVSLGTDLDNNSQSDGGITVREESIQLCDSAWMGDVSIGLSGSTYMLHTGPLETPGLANDCSTIIEFDYPDAGVSVDAASADLTAPDLTAPDLTAPDLTAPDLTTPDATTVDAGGSGCGDLTLLGECDGTVLRYCSDGDIEEWDCEWDFLECGVVDCLSSDACWGNDCVAPTGEACGLGRMDNFCNASVPEGCIDFVCAASASCTTADDVPSCDGNTLTWCYSPSDGPAGAVWQLDCSVGDTEPYLCGVDSSGVASCLGTLNAVCNPDNECAPGFSCNPANRCVAGNADAGHPVDATVQPDVQTLPDTGTPDDVIGILDAGPMPDLSGTDRFVPPSDASVLPDATVSSDAAQPDAARHDVPGSDAARPDVPGSDAAQPDVPGSDAAQPDAALPDNAVRDTRVADSARPDRAITTVDAGVSPVKADGGCSCGAVASSANGGLLFLVALGLVRRRRRQQ